MREFKIFEAPLTGFSLVEAGAGTGKTYNITSIYVRAIIELGLMPKNILVLTYTNAAAAELRSRIRQRINQALNVYETGNASDDNFLMELKNRLTEKDYNQLKQALYSLDEASISTIHSFCNNLLREEYIAFGVQPNFELVDTKNELLDESVDNYWHDFIKNSENDLGKSILLEYLLNQGHNPEKLAAYVKDFNPNKDTNILPDIQLYGDGTSLYKKLEDLYNQILNQYKYDSETLAYLMDNSDGKIFKTGVYSAYNMHKNELEEWLNGAKQAPKYTEGIKAINYSYIASEMYKKPQKEPIFPDICYMADEFLELLEQVEAAFLVDFIKSVNSTYIKEKRSKNLFTYDDLIDIVAEKVSNDKTKSIPSNIAKKFPLALIDEFQDTDEQQYKIFKTIYKDNPDKGLFMIGDPKQAIYSFRGADLYTYFKAREDVPENQRYSLLHNYRSSDTMIDAVNKLFNHKENAFLLDELKFSDAKPPIGKQDYEKLYKNGEEVTALQFIKIGEDYTNLDIIRNDVRQALLNEITELLSGNYTLGDRPVKASDIAILVSKNYEAEDIKDLLAQHDLQSVIISKETVFNTDEATGLLIILKAIINNGYEPNIKAALTTKLMGFTLEDLYEFTDNENIRTDITLLFADALKIWKEKGIRESLSKLNNTFKMVHNISKYRDGERRITNYYHILELLSNYEAEEHTTPSVLFRYLSEKINTEEEVDAKEDEVIRLESDEELISIVTQHSSKGLEYPIVFLASTWEEIKLNAPGSWLNPATFTFHLEGKSYKGLNLKIVNTDYFTKSRYEELTERIRLFYVALTRASTATLIPYGEFKNEKISPLTTLLRPNNDNILEDIHQRIYSKLKLDFKINDLLKPFAELSNITNREKVDFKDWDTPKIATSESDYKPKATEFTRNDVFDYPRMTSYSALTDKRMEPTIYQVQNEIEGRDIDEKEEFISDLEEKILESDNAIFNFPKGADTGNLIHNILEVVDFKSGEDMAEKTAKEVEYFGLSDEQQDTALQWIKQIVKHPILPDDTSLNKLNEGELSKEIEFYFPIENINVDEVETIIRDETISGSNADRKTIRGFMKGFIDLTFKHDDKYYILDYKTNHLGDRYRNYDVERLKNAIISDNYDIQYHIYTVALHRLLKNKLENYDYKKDFGGVVYLFVRGLNNEDKSQGVYFEKPDYSKISLLDKLFKSGVK